MPKILIGTGNFTWDAVERRSDRYGSVRLTNGNDDGRTDVLFDSALDNLEGHKGELYAEVLVPVKSPHMGDLARGIKCSTPDKGEIVVLGTGSLFIEHRGRGPHEKAQHERNDDEMFTAIIAEFERIGARMGANVILDRGGRAGMKKAPPTEVYDIVGLRPDDGREKDWLDPRAYYRLHLSKVNLWFETETGRQ
jgi:hypothetical protein